MNSLVFDTDVCITIAASPNRAGIMDCLRARYKIAASANTLLELLLAVCHSTEGKHFPDHQERFRVAIGSKVVGRRDLVYPLEYVMEDAEFLDYPLSFALTQRAQISRVGTGSGTQRYREYTGVLLAAERLDDLKNGVEWPPNPQGIIRPVTERRFLKCDAVEEDLKWGKYFHREPLDAAKAADLYFDDRLSWVKNLGLAYGVEMSDEQVAAMASALDAVYCYEETVWTMSRKGNFKPAKNTNDWIDMNQLFYLADPLLEFVTRDSTIRKRCSTSRQSQRVVLLTEVLGREGLFV